MQIKELYYYGDKTFSKIFILAPNISKRRDPRNMYYFDAGYFGMRAHYHTAVGLYPASSSLSTINKRDKREGCKACEVSHKN